jgi:hypothetical protein
MSGRILWFLAAALLIFLGTASTELAWARSGGGGGGGGGGFGRGGRVMASRGHGLRAGLRSNIVGARSIARNLTPRNGSGFGQTGFQNGFGFGRDGVLGGSQFPFWPFWPYFDTASMDPAPAAGAGPSDPFVVVTSGLPNGASERAAADPLPDYGYVAGCHAIPNGYHCDAPHGQATP